MLDQDPLLIRKRAAEGGWTALHIGSAYADGEMLTLLMAAGADVNGRDRRGFTPLFLATRQRYINAEMLLSNVAGIDARAKHGFTALHCAAAAGNEEFVRFSPCTQRRHTSANQRSPDRVGVGRPQWPSDGGRDPRP